MREAISDNEVASLQEELAATKLREAEANLALKDLKAKVADLIFFFKFSNRNLVNCDLVNIDLFLTKLSGEKEIARGYTRQRRG